MEGTVVSVHLRPSQGEPTRPVDEVRAVAGLGLAGDHAHSKAEQSGRNTAPPGQATLIESEALEAASREYGVTIEPSECRRNIVTQGVALNHLVNREFTVGDTVMRGCKLCEPCNHLEGLTRAGVREALVHRGGLRAEIVSGGDIRVGDGIRLIEG